MIRWLFHLEILIITPLGSKGRQGTLALTDFRGTF